MEGSGSSRDDLKHAHLHSIISERWKKVDPVYKQELYEKARIDEIRHYMEMQVWKLKRKMKKKEKVDKHLPLLESVEREARIEKSNKHKNLLDLEIAMRKQTVDMYLAYHARSDRAPNQNEGA